MTDSNSADIVPHLDIGGIFEPMKKNAPLHNGNGAGNLRTQKEFCEKMAQEQSFVQFLPDGTDIQDYFSADDLAEFDGFIESAKEKGAEFTESHLRTVLSGFIPNLEKQDTNNLANSTKKSKKKKKNVRKL